jgi:lipopolysaccharide transport system ATP-binding protein
MTLYPGGGFALEEPESDAKLEQVLDSPLLCGIIATQNVTLDYLKAKKCRVPVHDIYGGAMNPIYFESVIRQKRHLQNASALSICFVADRYMPQGKNKGYPQFIEAAKQLIRQFPDLQFTVVGGFDYEDYPLDNQLREVISFKGLLFTDELKKFFLTQDIIISPNRPFLLNPGNFDGFPTGCCIEASLCGVAVVCSDVLKLNRHYSNGEDMIICEPEPEVIVKAVGELISNPDLLRSISASGQRVSQKVFDPIRQLDQRANLLEKYAIENGVDIRARELF